MNAKLFDFIKNSPTAYHAVSHTADILCAKGFTELSESTEWKLEPGKGYFVTRGGSSLIAFKIPSENFSGFMLTSSHSDSPTFKIKENSEINDGKYIRLSVEKYGGMLCSTWLDRPLSVAGRVVVKTDDGFAARLVDMREPIAVIPNVAIHMNRKANDGTPYNAAVDMLPLFCEAAEGGRFMKMIAENADVSDGDILAHDLFLYNPENGCEWNGFISAPRLDDLQCAFAALDAFTEAEICEMSAPVYCLFDNEEVGSGTKQGADSTFLFDTLLRINDIMGGDGELYRRRLANSFMLSCDNAHAAHPNHPEFADKNHTVAPNGGVVIKYNASQKYTTDAVSSALVRLVCEEAGVPVQLYANRADMAGGSTLGNISTAHVSINTADIGIAQLAMHSALETSGARDTEYMAHALKVFYSKSFSVKKDGSFELK